MDLEWTVSNYKKLNTDFNLTMCFYNVFETLEYKTLKVDNT
jgi:hypothetical protein